MMSEEKLPPCYNNERTHDYYLRRMQEDREQVKAERNEAILDKQVGGDHYKDCKIQPVEYIHANGLDYFEGNVIKYVCRYKHKNGIQDLEKIKHYCDLEILKLKQTKKK